MNGVKGSYIGFTFNGIHSSILGVVRVSNSVRYIDNPLSEAKNITEDRIGADGMYYIGSQKKHRRIILSLSYANINDYTFNYLQKTYGDKQIHPLILDEDPYKVYSAKISGMISRKYLSFVKDDARVYSGEFSIEFTLYEEYGRLRYPDISNYETPNLQEWYDEIGQYGLYVEDGEDINSGIVAADDDPIWDILPDQTATPSTISIDESTSTMASCEHTNLDNNLNEWFNTPDIGAEQNNLLQVINNGDSPAYWTLRLKIAPIMAGTFSINSEIALEINKLKTDYNNARDYYVEFDSRTGLIEGRDKQLQKTHTIYYGYEFYNKQIPIGASTIDLSENWRKDNESNIEYHILYL